MILDQAVTHVIWMHISEPSHTRNVPFINWQRMFLLICIHVFQVSHKHCGIANVVERDGCLKAHDDNVMSNSPIASLNVGKLAEKGYGCQDVNSSLVNRFVVLVIDRNIISMAVNDQGEKLTVILEDWDCLVAGYSNFAWISPTF